MIVVAPFCCRPRGSCAGVGRERRQVQVVVDVVDDVGSGRLDLVLEVVPRGLELAVGCVVGEQCERARLAVHVAASERGGLADELVLDELRHHRRRLVGRRTGRVHVRLVVEVVLLRLRDDARTDAEDLLGGEFVRELLRLARSADDCEDALRGCTIGVGARGDGVAAQAGALDLHQLDLAAREVVDAPVELDVVLDRLLGRLRCVVRARLLGERVEDRIGLRDVVADLDGVAGHAGRRCTAVIGGRDLGGARRRVQNRNCDFTAGRVAVVLPGVLVERALRLGIVVEQRHAVHAGLGVRCGATARRIVVALLTVASAHRHDDNDDDGNDHDDRNEWRVARPRRLPLLRCLLHAHPVIPLIATAGWS